MDVPKVKLFISAFTFVCALFLSGCFFRRSNENVSVQQQPESSLREAPCLDSSTLQEAYLIDVPVPFGAQLVPEFMDIQKEGSGPVVAYIISQDIKEIVSFYEEEMEGYGWQRKYSFIMGEKEALFTFKRPATTCILSIRSDEYQDLTTLVIFLGQENN